nr:MAG: hypothetical protein J07AB56_00890 [Candidatus Nanosalinarum sp. J07AB56]
MRQVEVSTPGREMETRLAENALEKAWGLRRSEEGDMLFRTGRKVTLDSFLVEDSLNLYFLGGGRVLEIGVLEPGSIYRPDTGSEWLLESFESLDLEEGDRVTVRV